MTKAVAMQAVNSMSNAPALLGSNMTPNTMESTLTAMAGETLASADERSLEVRNALCAAYGFNAQSQNKPFVFSDGVAVIPVHGLLLNRFGDSYGYVTGYTFIRRQRDLAMADPDVKLVIYDVNSGGGEAAGNFELAQESFDMRGTKPTFAIVNSNCYSAAYAFASSADKIYVTPSGGAGSIGVVATHFDVSKMLDNYGIKVTFIHAGEHKVDGNSPARVDATYGRFVDLVAQNRGLDPKVVRDTQARCYSAQDALALGLIDGVASPMEALALISDGGAADDAQAMTANTDTEETAMEEAEVKKGERDRIKAITTCEAATGRTSLANHLAYETDMSAESAQAILAAAPVTAPVAAAPVVEGADRTAFQEAMNNGTHPEVGADTAAAEEAAAKDDALPDLCASYLAMTGKDLNKKEGK
ncbi:putative S49 family peptidase [Aeromonas phage AhMtk13b]|nr:putative S49 family peptidase [Aeromonas phage AhMtk13b]